MQSTVCNRAFHSFTALDVAAKHLTGKRGVNSSTCPTPVRLLNLFKSVRRLLPIFRMPFYPHKFCLIHRRQSPAMRTPVSDLRGQRRQLARRTVSWCQTFVGRAIREQWQSCHRALKEPQMASLPMQGHTGWRNRNDDRRVCLDRVDFYARQTIDERTRHLH